VFGNPPRGEWQIGIADPVRPGRLAAIVPVRAAMATSGDYERPGQIRDPRSGDPVARLLSATVTGPDLALADALATGLVAEGTAGLERVSSIAGYSAYAIDRAGVARVTPGFPPTRRPTDSHQALSKR
jgi:thiamine biosynthesis lipoprotein